MVKKYTQYTKIFESNQKILAGTLFKYYTFGNIRKMLKNKMIRVWDEYGILIPRLQNIMVTDVYLGIKIHGIRRVVVEINHLGALCYNDNWTIEIIEPKRVFSEQDPLGEEDWGDTDLSEKIKNNSINELFDSIPYEVMEQFTKKKPLTESLEIYYKVNVTTLMYLQESTIKSLLLGKRVNISYSDTYLIKNFLIDDICMWPDGDRFYIINDKNQRFHLGKYDEIEILNYTDKIKEEDIEWF